MGVDGFLLVGDDWFLFTFGHEKWNGGSLGEASTDPASLERFFFGLLRVRSSKGEFKLFTAIFLGEGEKYLSIVFVGEPVLVAF